MRNTLVASVDIGSSFVKVVVAEKSADEDLPKVIGTGQSDSKGIRQGYVFNVDEASDAVKKALLQAEAQSNRRVKKVYISVSGIGVSSIQSVGSSLVSRGDLVVGEIDIKTALENAEKNIPNQYIQNRKVLHVVPLTYKIDGVSVLGKPFGMKGNRLEVKALFIAALDHHISELLSVFEKLDIEVLDVSAAPIAASHVSLTRAQKMAGCVLANIGAETVSVVVFENNLPLSLEIFPIGSTNITNDIALGLRIPLEEAEVIKRNQNVTERTSKRKLDDIISSRLTDIFELIEAHLKRIGRSGLLPAGIVVTGGGSRISHIEDIARATLRLPSRMAHIHHIVPVGKDLIDPAWSVAYGLCVLGFSTDDSNPNSITTTRSVVTKVVEWFKQFLP